MGPRSLTLSPDPYLGIGFSHPFSCQRLLFFVVSFFDEIQESGKV
jgi:hypothetical protein